MGEVADIVAGGDIAKNKLLASGAYPVIANSLNNEGIVGYYSEDYRIEAPAVTVTGRGEVGVAFARKVNFTPVVRLLALKSQCDSDFLANAINQQHIFIESTGVPQLTVPQLSNIRILLPVIPEQTTIGTFFSTLDTLITLHQRECLPNFIYGGKELC
ncbi:type I restriction endonuclease subunit S [Streptococcus cuniculi]|uniref:Type I restriction endonuclease subunit S n=1 Tax=Streptococcus cuniculi TaxID=1432788 RepID=A0A1Q8E8H6_9STRE|nr:type I restriction endonuclease subunit S [Streptococcus cuniculi]